MARFLRQVTGWLDPEDGWYGAFLRRDAAGMHACLDGSELPPWDVVDALLQDLAAHSGGHTSQAAASRARTLHRDAVAAYDARSPDRGLLEDRLRLMTEEHQRAAEREWRLRQALYQPADPFARQELNTELAWARDDLARAAARCAELRRRIDALPGERPTAAAKGPPAAARPRGARFAGADYAAEAAEAADTAARAAAEATETAARAAEATAGPAARAGPAEPPVRPPAAAAAPTPPAAAPPPAVRPPSPPSGARFAGVGPASARRRKPAEDAAHAAARRAAAYRVAGDTAAKVVQARAAGRTGEAYAHLSAAVAGPPEALPVLAAELERAGSGAEVATLLWEAAALPGERIAAAVGALSTAGRADDARRLLRHSGSRPVAELADIVLALGREGREGEAGELLAAFVGARTADEGVELAAAEPGWLVPLLLTAARRVSSYRHRELAHALRSAGLPGAPDSA